MSSWDSRFDLLFWCTNYFCALQKFGGMGDGAMGDDDFDESDDEGKRVTYFVVNNIHTFR